MANGKKSFLLYCDLIHTVSKLPDEKAGQLFKHILEYVNDQNPGTEDLIIQLTFEPVKQSLKRDLEKYESIRAKNKESADKRWHASASKRIRKVRKHADSDSDSVNDIDKRKKEFYAKVAAFKERYTPKMLREFYDYWTEHSENGLKMRFEKQSVFDLEKRLATWARNEKPEKGQKSTFSPSLPKSSLDDETSN